RLRARASSGCGARPRKSRNRHSQESEAGNRDRSGRIAAKACRLEGSSYERARGSAEAATARQEDRDEARINDPSLPYGNEVRRLETVLRRVLSTVHLCSGHRPACSINLVSAH